MRRMMVLAALAQALWGCSSQPMRDLRHAFFTQSKGYYALHLGMQQFDDGTYAEAAHNLQLALDMGLSEGEQTDAHKYLAFIHCASGRAAPCRDEFRRALAIDPQFDLAPAERGHPVWGPVFAAVKANGSKRTDVAGLDPLLQAGVRLYEDGDYAESARSLQTAIDHGLPSPQRARAHKYLAFIHCVSNREQLCREEFRKALAEDPTLELAPAEAGHPIWGPIFRAVKAGR
jgi:Tfp pilus assembly protein PilF